MTNICLDQKETKNKFSVVKTLNNEIIVCQKWVEIDAIYQVCPPFLTEFLPMEANCCLCYATRKYRL